MADSSRTRSARATLPGVLLLALAGGLVSGCVNQEKEVAQYRSVLDGPKPSVLPIYRQYQNGLSLETALLLANRNQEQLALSGESYLQALIDKDRAYSQFLPTISLAPVYNWTQKPSRTNIGGSVTGTTGGALVTNSSKRQTFDVPIAAGYQGFNAYGDVANVYRAANTVEQRRALLLDLQQTILLEVAQTYYSVLSAEQSVAVLLNSVAVQDEAVRDMQGRQHAGVARPLDVAQTEAQAASTRVSLIAAQNNVRNGRITLAFLMAAPVDNVPLVDQLDVPSQLMPLRQAVADAQANRQDVAAARAAVEASRQTVQQTLGEYFPSVTLNVDYFLHKETIPTNTDWTALLSANIPLFTGFRAYQDVRTAWSNLREAWLNLSLTTRQVNEQVEQAYVNIIDSARRLRELRTEVAAAQEALRQAEQSYIAGLATNLERLTAQDQLLTAQLNFTAEDFNYKTDYLDLLRAVGKLLRPESPKAIVGPATAPTKPEIFTPGQPRGLGSPAATEPADGSSPLPATTPGQLPETIQQPPTTIPATN